MQKILDEMCLLISGLLNAPRVAITKSYKRQKRIEIMASSAPFATDINRRLTLPLMREPLIFSPNFRTDPEMNYEDLRELLPNIRSLAAYLIYDTNQFQTALVILNPPTTFFSDDRLVVIIERFAEILRQIIDMQAENESIPHHVAPGMFEEVHKYSSGPVNTFLSNTLVKKQRLLVRGGASYLALRRWRKELKPYQLEAFHALKSNHDSDFEDLVVAEFKEVITRLYGNLFNALVPIPGGSSGTERSFSVRVAEKLARELNIPMSMALQAAPVPIGKSHPSKSASLQPYVPVNPPVGNILIVDDVASSGRHIELATNALRNSANYVSSIVWVAD